MVSLKTQANRLRGRCSEPHNKRSDDQKNDRHWHVDMGQNAPWALGPAIDRWNAYSGIDLWQRDRCKALSEASDHNHRWRIRKIEYFDKLGQSARICLIDINSKTLLLFCSLSPQSFFGIVTLLNWKNTIKCLNQTQSSSPSTISRLS